MPNTMLIDVKGLGLVKPTLTTTAYLLLLICATLSGYSVTRLLVGFPLKKVLHQFCLGPLLISLSSLQEPSGTDGSCDGGTMPGNTFHCKFAK